MLVKANRKNLKKHARALLGDRWTPEREQELIRTALTFEVSDYAHGHPSHAQAEHLEQLDAILGTCGVEGFVEPDVQYCNKGDTYDMTLLYWDGELWIGDWGSVVEECESAEA